MSENMLTQSKMHLLTLVYAIYDFLLKKLLVFIEKNAFVGRIEL